MKLIKKIKNKLNNNGSSILMVIVSLAFVGIVVAALLSAAGYTYKQKLQELNAKDNYYYVDQAMEEIYAGVGSQTISELKAAYSYTLENMVRYDTEVGTYYTISDKEANAMFKQQFLNNIKNSKYFNQGTTKLSECLQDYISNETVQIDADKLSVVKKNDSITIQNITLTRTQEYNRSTANGVYTQTVSADITISEPDFEVKFNNVTADYSKIFNYAMVADMGIEVNELEAPLSIIGNIYAASDYYNKSYNNELNEASVPGGTLTASDFTGEEKDNTFAISGTYDVGGESEKISYEFNNVTNKKLTLGVGDTQIESGFVNDYQKDETNNTYLGFDGVNDNSKYSGFYINNSKVSVVADTMIVPGTLSIMNTSDFTIYGKANATDLTQLWADDIVLGGKSTKNIKKSTDDKTVYDGSSATFKANLFVKDDTEINATSSSIKLVGSYYGYGDSTSRDSRVYFDTVDKNYFMLPEYDDKGVIKRDSEGNIIYKFNRGHYNSSAILVNGEDSKLDFSLTKQIYLAGRAYIELSKYVTDVVDVDAGTRTDEYQYIPSYTKVNTDGSTEEVFIEDFKTGESLSYKPNQAMYIVTNLGVAKTEEASNNESFSGIKLPDDVRSVAHKDSLNNLIVTFRDYSDIKLLDNYTPDVDTLNELFPVSIFKGNIPVKTQTIKYKDEEGKSKSRDYSLVDFETAYNIITNVSKDSADAGYDDAQYIVSTYDSIDKYETAYTVFCSLVSSVKVISEESIRHISTSKQAVAKATVETIRDSYDDFEDITYRVERDARTGEIKKIEGNSGFDYGANNYESIDGNTSLGTNDKDIYSSGLISVAGYNNFTLVTNNDKNDTDGKDAVSKLLENSDYLTSYSTVADGTVMDLSDDLEMEYNYVKWNLGHYEDNSVEKQYVKDVVAVYGEDSITPINKYMMFDKFAKASDTDVVENYELGSASGATTYRIWATNNDVVVSGDENVVGMVITTGDVSFDEDVKSFEGIIISGGKIYVNGNVTNLNAAPATCREILRQCMVVNDKDCQFVLDLFREYEKIYEDDSEGEGEGTKEDTPSRTLDSVNYTDVVSVANWMKNIGGAYATDEN